MRTILSTLFVLISACAMSQVKFASIGNVGTAFGASSVSLQAQTINGVKYKGYTVGLGVGYDEYYFKTIPLFIDLRKHLLNKMETPFVYLDLGTNFPLEKDLKTAWQSTSYHNGIYLDAGVGYSWKLTSKTAFIVSAGYSKKQVKEDLSFTWTVDGMGPETFDYHFNRVSLKAGLSF